MGLVTSAMLIVSGAYLALGLMYLRFWFNERSRRDYLGFSIGCICYAVFAWLERGMMTAATPQEYLSYTWWAYFPGNIGLIAFAWFAYLHLHGRKWLFWTFGSLRALTFIFHLVMPLGLHFREISGLGYKTVLGETLSYPLSVPNPLMALSHLGHVLMIIFFLDASVRCWRYGRRRQALIFGTGTVLFGTAVLLIGPLVLWGVVPVPIMASFAVLFIIAPLLYELNYDMHRAAMLSENLEEREASLAETLEQLQLSAAAGNVGMWTRKVGEDDIWVSEKAGEIWGFPGGKTFCREELFEHIHPADRELFITTSQELDEGKNEFEIEYRMLSGDGDVRWIHTSGKVELARGTRVIRGAIVDITNLKLAQIKLADTLEKLELAASAGNVGMWTRTIGGEIIWASEKALEIWGFARGEQVTQADFIQHVHPDDRARFFTLFQELEAGKNDYQREYRIQLKDGNIRWIHSRGKVEQVDGARIIRGAIVDISQLRLAEGAVRDLSRRLIDAQENERARVALELHDDLNQSIALLSIQLGMLQNQPKDLAYVKDQLGRLVSDVQHLSRDVHRISHELHPGKLAQLGLEAALTGFCREFSSAHPVEIDLATRDVPRDLPLDISLCLYRVTQESLNNVIKHSGATLAHVSVRSEANEIRLAVRDNGNGFDPDGAKAKGGLGLMSIDERVRHVNGKSEIVSAVGEGTKIEVRIPVAVVEESQMLQMEVVG